jgi:hypothetical protein
LYKFLNFAAYLNIFRKKELEAIGLNLQWWPSDTGPHDSLAPLWPKATRAGRPACTGRAPTATRPMIEGRPRHQHPGTTVADVLACVAHVMVVLVTLSGGGKRVRRCERGGLQRNNCGTTARLLATHGRRPSGLTDEGMWQGSTQHRDKVAAR